MNQQTNDELIIEIQELKKQVGILSNNISRLLEYSSNDLSASDFLMKDLRSGQWDLTPKTKVQHGWDNLVDPWIEIVPTIGDKIPSAYRIWQSSHRYFKAGDEARADRCERLNYLLHNSYIPSSLELRGEVIFGYGGIGVILHKDSDIHPFVTIGANVTVGGNGSAKRIDKRTQKWSTVPELGTLSVIGAGSNITGGISVAPMTIVAPNTVLTKNTEAGSIMGGVPAKKIGQVTMETALRYKAKYLVARSWDDDKYLEICRKYLPEKQQ